MTASAPNKLTEELSALVGQVSDDLHLGRLALPALPDVIVQIHKALASDNYNARQIARIVQLDPALSGRVLQIANSARYLGQHKVASVQEAITRLGMRPTVNLATALTLHNALHCKHPRLRERMEEVWRESCRVAAISHVLASTVPGLRPDQAMLGGLVHQIGTIALIPYLANYPQLLDFIHQPSAEFLRLSGTLGSTLLRHWQFDSSLIPIPEEANNWMRDMGDAVDYVDVVLVARVHAMLGTEAGDKVRQLLCTMPAFRKFPVSRLGPDASISVIETAQNEIATFMALLRGK